MLVYFFNMNPSTSDAFLAILKSLFFKKQCYIFKKKMVEFIIHSLNDNVNGFFKIII